MTRMVHCIKLDENLEGLDNYPIPGELGKRIYNHVSKEAWAMWIKQQTIIINENRLNLADKNARDFLKQQMEYYFFGNQE